MRVTPKGLLIVGIVLLAGSETRADEFVRVEAGTLSVREGPGTQHRVLGTANRGQALRLHERSGSWIRIKDGVRSGWVHGGYVDSLVPETQHVINQSGLKVRSGPGTRFRQLGILSLNASVFVIESRRNWRKIGYGDSTGWVYGRYLADGVGPRSTTPSVGAVGGLDDPLNGGSTLDGADSTARVTERAEAETRATPTRSGTVVYRRRVSDAATRDALQRLADQLGKTVVVHSGDRHRVVRGSSRGSLHMRRRAADFHVTGMTDSAVFEFMRQNHAEILGGGSFEVILHRRGTNTGGPHLHLGNYADRRGTYYKSERRGRYTRIAHVR